jgi:hypothetical protein
LPRRLNLRAAIFVAAALCTGALSPGPRAHAQSGWEPVTILPKVAQNAAPDPALTPSDAATTSDGIIRPSLDTRESLDNIEVVQPEQQPTPLGGLGDEAPPVVPLEEPTLAEDEDVVSGFGINLLPDSRLSLPRLVRSALNPEPHDLDPYLPVGIKVGSFILYPEIETGVVGTNNVLGTRTDRHADAAYELGTSLRAQSDWSRHSLTFIADADNSWYANFPVEDDRIYEFLLRGRLDVSRRTHLAGEIEASQTQVGRSSASLTDIAGVQTNLHERHAIVGGDHTFNRLTLAAAQTFAEYDYDDQVNAGFVEEGGVPFQDVRDYTEALTTLRGTYEFNSAWAGFVEGALSNREYAEPVNVAGFRRGSEGYSLLTGANLRLGPRLFGEIAFGWGSQAPIDDRLAVIEGPLIDADLIWMLTPMTKLEFIARSEIDETTLDESAGAIDRFYSLSLQHAFWRYLVLGTFVSYERADYAGVDQVDQRLKGGLTGEYYFNPVVSVYGRYEHTNFVSTFSENNFEEDQVRMGLKLRR